VSARAIQDAIRNRGAGER